ncbi:hypothetical protein [Zwartia panacis]|uniref:hypothetical protein n=1 Tax=Zwartia panacis TaxID=2683345 RepID=UPI0025B2B548|nr:hypothetical protein [Zwartia panacis]MDN4016168.1 hypothetical protein [Zwartia panacis]
MSRFSTPTNLCMRWLWSKSEALYQIAKTAGSTWVCGIPPPTTGRTLYDKLMRCLGEIAHTHDTD